MRSQRRFAGLITLAALAGMTAGCTPVGAAVDAAPAQDSPVSQSPEPSSAVSQSPEPSPQLPPRPTTVAEAGGSSALTSGIRNAVTKRELPLDNGALYIKPVKNADGSYHLLVFCENGSARDACETDALDSFKASTGLDPARYPFEFKDETLDKVVRQNAAEDSTTYTYPDGVVVSEFMGADEYNPMDAYPNASYKPAPHYVFLHLRIVNNSDKPIDLSDFYVAVGSGGNLADPDSLVVRAPEPGQSRLWGLPQNVIPPGHDAQSDDGWGVTDPDSVFVRFDRQTADDPVSLSAPPEAAPGETD